MGKHRESTLDHREIYRRRLLPAALAAPASPALGRKVSVTAAANWREHGAFLEPNVELTRAAPGIDCLCHKIILPGPLTARAFSNTSTLRASAEIDNRPSLHKHNNPTRHTPDYTMAKGLRASTERTNRRKLRANVFGPVEKARAERLHAKLLATINSEKPARPEKKEMDVDEEGTHLLATIRAARANVTAATEAKDDLSKGSFFLTAPVPQSLCTSTPAPPDGDEDMRSFCFYLGLSSDILGFTSSGSLQFAFDPLPPSS